MALTREEARRLISFDGFSDQEKIRMMDGFNRMKIASGRAKTALLGGDLVAYRKWFEASGATQVMKVGTIVNEVDAAINGRPITFAKLDRPGVNVNIQGLCAYVFLVRSGEFAHHVGSGMRILVVWKTHASHDVTYLSQTMYHELTHKIGSTTDIVYNRAQCQQLAVQRPADAARNAENYNLFLSEFF